MTNSEKMRADRAKLIADAREILTAADEESRQLTAEERAKYDRIDDDIDGRGADIARTEKLEKVESAIMRTEERSSEAGNVQAIERRDDEMEYRQAFLDWARTGERRSLTPDPTGTPFGGYTVPTAINNEIVKVLEDMSFMRQNATIIQVQGNQQIPVENTLGAASWQAENQAIADSNVVFDKVTLSPNRLASLITVSTSLMDNNAFGDTGLESYLVGNFARRFAVAEETAFVFGTGTNQPTGVVPAQADAAVDSDTAGGLAVTGDDVIDLFHAVGRSYRNSSAGWIMHDSTGKKIRKLTEGSTGNYLWQPGLAAGTPDRLLGHPVYYSSDMEEFNGVDKRVMAFGDLSYYYISEHGPRQMQRLNERYADTGQVGFVMSHHIDGELTNTAAVKLMSTPAS